MEEPLSLAGTLMHTKALLITLHGTVDYQTFVILLCLFFVKHSYYTNVFFGMYLREKL